MVTQTAVDVVMPQMGVSVSEGTVTRWLKSVGDAIAADEPLLEISTDKVDTEVPSPAEGVLASIAVQEGETVPVGTVIATIAPAGAVPVEQPAAPAPPPPASEAGALPLEAERPPAPPPAPVPERTEAEAPGDGRTEGRAFVSPVVARIAAEHGVDVSQIEGTGRGGRVTKRDILAFIEAGAVAPPPMKVREEAVAEPPTLPAMPEAKPLARETVEPMSVMRKAIAEHMLRSVHTSAHVTTVFEVDMSRVVAIRDLLKGEYEQHHGVRLTYLPFVCRAVVDVLQKWPWLNAEIRGDQIVLKHEVNLGIAVALEGGKGLIVPVVRNAEERNLLGMARAIADLAERARTKKLVPDEVQGGTFTITNPGSFGAIAGTPIINQPQVGILDVEAIVKRPVVVADEHGHDAIAIRPIMNLCLSYDHRLVDGAYAAPFMRDLKANLETWEVDAY
jgi:2-oxoglutarate dehydrogenase E2 component (dihydrolipoamide succinyltransferase)